MNGRHRLAGFVIAGVILAAAVGWVAGRQIDSPAEVASRTDPPNAAPILVPAEERVLSTDIVTRGTARFGSPQQLSLARSALKTDFGVASRLPVAGTELKEGDLVFTTSGRPVFLLSGTQPMFRDLGPGIRGDDVRQLEDALGRMGFDPGPIDGVYDAATEAAVRAWYERSGFAAFTASPEQLAAVRALEADRNNIELDVISAEEAVLQAEATLAAADHAYLRAFDALNRAMVAVSAASATATANNNAAAAAVASQEAALNALRAGGATPAEIAAAEADVALARANADAVRISGQRDVSDAQASEASARADESAALSEVRAAETALTRFDAALSVRYQQADLVAADLSLARLQAGVQVPADELLFIASTPVRVADAKAGDQAGGALVTVTNAVVAIDGALQLEEASLAEPGMTVMIDEADLNIEATGKISRVADTPGTNGADGFHVYFELLVDGAPPNLVGASVRLKIPVESTGGSVLAVPVSALSLSADGSSRIQRQGDTGLEYVTVKPGLSANGYVAVEPIDGSLKAGDLVVIGFDQTTRVSR
jgi:peptidoglycan hydrolase-like protein with peptidoglycan-binding domain